MDKQQEYSVAGVNVYKQRRGCLPFVWPCKLFDSVNDAVAEAEKNRVQRMEDIMQELNDLQERVS